MRPTIEWQRLTERLAAAVALALALTVWTGCGESPGADGRVGRRDYSFAAGKVTLPDDFPEDVPLPEDRRLLLARRFDVVVTNVIVATSRSAADTEEFYRRRLMELGWQFMSEGSLEGQRFLGFESGNRALSLVIAPEGEETVVSLSLAPALRR